MREVECFVGIDPGKSPGLCLIDIRGDIISTKLLKDKKGEMRHLELFEWVRTSSYGAKAAMELPHSVFSASSKSNFQFGLSVGACKQSLISTFPKGRVKFPQPKEWQKLILIDNDIVIKKGKKDTKSTAFAAAKRILGNRWDYSVFLPTERSSVANHNLIDAYLIAEYCRITHINLPL